VPGYRCYYLDSADHVAATELIDCDTDILAAARADGLLAACAHSGIEVWDRGRRVYYARRTDGSVASDPR
jgi:hypothetical protein